MFSEIAKFEVDGRWYEARAKSKSTTPLLVGTKVEVKYDQSNPNNSYIYKKGDDVLLIVIGVFFGGAGLLIGGSFIKDLFIGASEKNRKNLIN